MALAVAQELARTTTPAVRLVGGLFSPDLLEQLRTSPSEVSGQRPKDFGCADERQLRDDIAEAYRDALQLWDIFQRRLERLPETDRATSLTRDARIIPLFRLLGYELERNPRAYELAGQTYFISHRASPAEDAPPIHIAGARQDLGRIDPSGRPRLSPHTLVQEFLNRSDHLWGITTNGLSLRLLRTSPALRTESYLEFDLQAMFDGERFTDFTILYRLLHRSRLPHGIADAHQCWLERYHQTALQQGSRARERLRDGVEQALLALGNGFLRHQENRTLHEALRSGELTPARYYELLLRLVYRLLFLLVTEERGLLGGNDLYRQGYSIERLRRLSEEPRAADDHDDLWAGLTALFELLRGTRSPDGRPLASLLDLPVLDGELFRPEVFEQWRLSNRDLLTAIGSLSRIPDERGTLRRVNYDALDVEELGSVYESLLDHAPLIELTAPPRFTWTPGSQRKSTGSYYTPPELVRELVSSALEPVLQARLSTARTREEKERAILNLNICDPAAGSGHFLLAAARRLARELARIRSGEDEPPPERQREAIRDVITHCLYAVDKNPLAVELCKVALWLEAHSPGQPLTFLDHRIKCGDSLVGVFDLSVLNHGIPDEAYERDDAAEKAVAKGIRKHNRIERDTGQLPLGPGSVDVDDTILRLGIQREEIERMPERTLDERRKKQQASAKLDRDPIAQRLRLACDLWTAAFFVDLQQYETVPTSGHVRRALAGALVDPKVAATAAQLASDLRFFHWPLEFPDVFAGGGFDVVLGNPPWEQMQAEEVKFFAAVGATHIARLTGKERKRAIEALERDDPALDRAWKTHQRLIHLAAQFARRSGRFPKAGRGKINTYAVFAELAWRLLNGQGRAGIIVPTGIATDDTTKDLFAALVEDRALVSLFDFENRYGIFPAIAGNYRFCLLTLAGGEHPEPPRFASMLHRPEDLHDPGRIYTLTANDFQLMNPNTHTAPVFTSQREAELVRRIYQRVPILLRERPEEQNPWGVTFCQGLFNMTSKSHLFRTRTQLEAAGFYLVGNIFVRGEERYLPLYEGKVVHQFDHRWASFGGPGRLGAPPEPGTPPLLEAKPREADDAPGLTLQAKRDPTLVVLPRYWVAEEEVRAQLRRRGWSRSWLLGWRDIARSTDERTVIASVVPAVGVGDKLLLLMPHEAHGTLAFALLANLNALVLDRIARSKLVGTSLKFHIIKQLPILPPATYAQPCPWDRERTLAEWMRPRVLELVYTAWDLAPFARDLGDEGPPFQWDLDRRAQLRAELDAAYCLLYGLERSDVEFVLEGFPVLQKNEQRAFGEYRTARLVLATFDALVTAQALGEPYRSPLNPPPGDDRARHQEHPTAAAG